MSDYNLTVYVDFDPIKFDEYKDKLWLKDALIKLITSEIEDLIWDHFEITARANGEFEE